MMDLGLKDKVALITGGSLGIGKAAAWRLAQLGTKVAISARRKDVLEQTAHEIIKDTGGEVLPIVADVSQPDQIQAMMDRVIEAYGTIDILVNNAGTSQANHFDDLSDDDWMAAFDLMVFAFIRTSRLAVPYMKNRGGGRIINVGSVSGKTPGARSVPTSVTRAAGMAVTKAMSKDYAKDNILVNMVLIGLIDSEQVANMGTKRGLSTEQWYEQLSQRIPLGRVGESIEGGDPLVFLASNMASYITGVVINIDGGRSDVW